MNDHCHRGGSAVAAPINSTVGFTIILSLDLEYGGSQFHIRLCSHRLIFMLMTWKIPSIFSSDRPYSVISSSG